jgi:hypothetical protein
MVRSASFGERVSNHEASSFETRFFEALLRMRREPLPERQP